MLGILNDMIGRFSEVEELGTYNSVCITWTISNLKFGHGLQIILV